MDKDLAGGELAPEVEGVSSWPGYTPNAFTI